jgi:hypothetical protein
VFDDEAKERQRASGGDKTKKAVKENLPEPKKGQSRDKAGEGTAIVNTQKRKRCSRCGKFATTG